MPPRPEALKIAAVLLAAGASSRLGRPKQSVKVHGESLVRRAALQLLTLNLASVTVVTGSGSGAVQQELQDLQLRMVHNDNWAQGIGGSIACGVLSIADQVDGLLIALCDQWKVDESDLNRLKSVWSADISRVCTASWNEEESLVYGPPVLFPRKFIRELVELEGDRGAKHLIARNIGEVKFVSMENAAFDLDSPEDLERLLRQAGPNPSS